MKKIVSIASAALLLCCLFCIFTACSDDKKAVIESYDIEAKEYTVGDTFSTNDVVITAVLQNGEKHKIDSNLKFDTSEIDAVLTDGVFKNATESGKAYTVTVYAVEEREDMKIGEWKITVVDKD